VGVQIITFELNNQPARQNGSPWHYLSQVEDEGDKSKFTVTGEKQNLSKCWDGRLEQDIVNKLQPAEPMG